MRDIAVPPRSASISKPVAHNQFEARSALEGGANSFGHAREANPSRAPVNLSGRGIHNARHWSFFEADAFDTGPADGQADGLTLRC